MLILEGALKHCQQFWAKQVPELSIDLYGKPSGSGFLPGAEALRAERNSARVTPSSSLHMLAVSRLAAACPQKTARLVAESVGSCLNTAGPAPPGEAVC